MSAVVDVLPVQIRRVGTNRPEFETFTVAGCTGHWIKGLAVGRLESYAERIVPSLAPVMLLPRNSTTSCGTMVRMSMIKAPWVQAPPDEQSVSLTTQIQR